LIDIKDLLIIIGNLKSLFMISAITMAAMVPVCFLLGEAESSAGFVYGLILSLVCAAAIHFTVPLDETLELKHAMAIVAIAYLLIPSISTIPYLINLEMSPIDAFFEAISGWTGSGFSMISLPETIGRPMQFWRSLTQWIGGAGVILLMTAILIRPGTASFALYKSEAHKDRIRPSILSTIKVIWKLYLLLTLASIALLYIVGMPLWDSLNTAMTTISTGGFSVYGKSIGHYGNPTIELTLIVIMIMGALPFITLYKAYKHDLRVLLNDIQVRAFIALILMGCIALIVQNYFYYYHQDVYSSLGYSAFQLFSAATCTGLQNTDISRWPATALLILSVMMIIGGCAGSTAGGVKISRWIFLVTQVKLWLARTLLPRKAVVVIKLGDRKVTEQEISQELSEASLISFLWIVILFASIMLLSNILPSDVSLGNVIFEVCSAISNVGLTAGIVNPGMSSLAKAVFMADMWMGRLEIIPVLLFIRALLKGFGTV
jgi:trk system potassium uptake protein TrkH